MAFELAKAFVTIGTSLEPLKSGLTSAGSMVHRSITSWKTMVTAAVAGAGTGFGVKWAVGLASAAEDSTMAFNVIIKDLDKTRALMAELNKYSVITPFTPAEVRKAGQTLVQTGTAVENVVPTLQVLGDLAAGAGGNLQDLSLAFAKLRQDGRLMAEVEERFQTAGIPLRALAKQSGLLTGEWNKMREKGQLTFGLIEKVLKKATAAGGMFYQATAKQATTLSGLWSTLIGNLEQVGQTFGEAIMPMLKAMTTALIEFLNSMQPKFEEWARNIEQSLSGVTNSMIALSEVFKTNMTEVALVVTSVWRAMTQDIIAMVEYASKVIQKELYGESFDVKVLKSNLRIAKTELAEYEAKYAQHPGRLVGEHIKDLKAEIQALESMITEEEGVFPSLRGSAEFVKAIKDALGAAQILKEAFGRGKAKTEVDQLWRDWQGLQKRPTRVPFGTGAVGIEQTRWQAEMDKLERRTAAGQLLGVAGSLAHAGQMLGGSIARTWQRLPERRTGMWGGRMEFNQLNEAVQDALLSSENPVIETNKILSGPIKTGLEDIKAATTGAAKDFAAALANTLPNLLRIGLNLKVATE